MSTREIGAFPTADTSLVSRVLFAFLLLVSLYLQSKPAEDVDFGFLPENIKPCWPSVQMLCCFRLITDRLQNLIFHVVNVSLGAAEKLGGVGKNCIHKWPRDQCSCPLHVWEEVCAVKISVISVMQVKAKAAVKYVDHIITLAKRGDDHARIQAKAFVYDPHLVDNIFIGAPQRFKDRDGGYCRVIRPPTIALRRGDRAEMAILQLSDLDAYGV
jgi:large subunit ribosomal protein L17